MNHKHTNRLIDQTSPYLLQHAHNPVDWFPWTEEALEKARREDKPVLVSIGYAACHWCHVMEKESFENEDVAAFMNEHFVNIKIDREERPDIDHIYMDAVQSMTGSGGWPLNVFLTPDGKPFYGGTYFPPVKAYNRSSWMEVLMAIHETYKNRKDEVKGQAENLTKHLQTTNAFELDRGQNNEELFNEKTLDEIAANVMKTADKKWGGFGRPPKFPQTFSIQYLLRYGHLTGQLECLRHALLSLDKMMYGGLYDQLGGGFARYSTDEEWLAPHFEKMLYDNALLVGVLAEAFQLTEDRLYFQVINETLGFVVREMMSPEGGFYSALDADSEGVEGKFYTWSKDEIDAILGVDSAEFCDFFDVSAGGNWEHTNILRVKTPLHRFAKDRGLNEDELSGRLQASKKKLIAVRNRRVRPQLDDKILLGWNALMNVAFCKAFEATGDVFYKEIAIKNAVFLENSFTSGENEWLHTYKDGKAKYPAFLDDLAYLVSAYIHLQEITGDTGYLLKAKKISDWIIANFLEEETAFFFFTGKNQRDVIFRKKEIYDAAIPSGNSTMAFNLQYLVIVFNRLEWRQQAWNLVSSVATVISNYPTSFGNWACLLLQQIFGVTEIAVTGKNCHEILPGLLKNYIPNRIIQAAAVPSPDFPLLRDKDYPEQSWIYVCKDYACTAPVKDIRELKLLLK